MKLTQHFNALKKMYARAPINEFYQSNMEIFEGACEIEMDIKKQFHHTGGAIHGSVYFKMLDDAAIFAACSVETEVMVLTSSFTTYLTRPVSEGKLRAVGKLLNQNKTQYIAEAVLYNRDDREVARGSGLFVRSKMPLDAVPGYEI